MVKLGMNYNEIINRIELDSKYLIHLRTQYKDMFEELKNTNNELKLKTQMKINRQKYLKTKGKLEVYRLLFPKVAYGIQAKTFEKKNFECPDCGIKFEWGYYSNENLTEFWETPKTHEEWDDSELYITFASDWEFDNIEDVFWEEHKLCDKCIQYLKTQHQNRILQNIKDCEEDKWDNEIYTVI